MNRIVCVWREGYDYSRAMEDWIHEFEHQSGAEVENIDPGTAEGTRFCETYGIVEYPAILALDGNGASLADWRGETLPLLSDVSYWVNR